MDSSWFLKCGTMNISANISEEKAGCSIGVEISGHREGEKGTHYSFVAACVFLS